MTRQPRPNAAGALATTLASTLLGLLALPAGADTLLVVRKSADALDFVDPGSGLRLATVDVGHGPHEVAVSPDGRLAVVSNYGTRERPGTSLSVVDLAEPRELRRIELGADARPHGVAWYAPDRVAVTAEGVGQLLVVDPHAGRVVRATPTSQRGSHMVAVTPDARHAFVANLGAGSLSVLALDGPAETARTVDTGAGTEGVAVRPDGREVWVTARTAGRLVRLDASTLEQVSATDLPCVPIRIAFGPDGASAFVSCAGSGEVVAYDAATGRERARRRLDVPVAAAAGGRPAAGLAPGSPLPVGLAVARDGGRVFVAATLADQVVELDARTLAIVRHIAVDGEPDGLALTPVMPRATCHACSSTSVGEGSDTSPGSAGEVARSAGEGSVTSPGLAGEVARSAGEGPIRARPRAANR